MSRHAETLRSVVAVLVGALLVVSVSVGGAGGPGVVGTAEADGPVDCYADFQQLTAAFLTLGIAGDTTIDQCGGGSDPTENIDDNQTALDIYSAAQAAAQSWDEFSTVTQNYLSDTRTVAFAKAQAAAIEAIDQGATQSEAEAAGVKAIEDYYAARQINYIQAFETKVVTFLELQGRSQSESGVENQLVFASGDESNFASGDINEFLQTTQSVSLVNSSSLSLTTFYMGGYETDPISPERAPEYGIDLFVQSIDSEHPGVKVLNASAVPDTWDKYQSASSQVEDNIKKWVNSTYGGFQDGTLNVSTALNPLTLAQEYSQQYNESGYYAYSAASLASIGYSTPNLSRTASMTVEINGTNRTGLLLSQNVPDNGTWTAGETYDPSFIQGQQLFASQENGTLALEEPFTIQEIRDKSGSTISSTSTQEYAYQSINNTQYVQLQEQLTDLRKELESREPINTGGGGGLGGGGNMTLLAGLALVLAAVVVLRGDKD